MYKDIYDFNVLREIESGALVCCTDRQKGENFYCNGMIVSDLIAMLKDADADQTNRYQFYKYIEPEQDEEDTDDES